MSFIEQGLIQGKVVSGRTGKLIFKGTGLVEKIQRGQFLLKKKEFESVVSALAFSGEQLLFAVGTRLGLIDLTSDHIAMIDTGSEIRSIVALDDARVFTGDHLGVVRLWDVSASKLKVMGNWEFRRAIDGLKRVGDAVLVQCGWPRPEVVIIKMDQDTPVSVYQGKDICSMDLSRSGIAAVGTFSGDVVVRRGDEPLTCFTPFSGRGMVRVHFVEREGERAPFLLAIGFHGVWGFDLEIQQSYQFIVPEHIASSAVIGESVYVNTFSRGVSEVGLMGAEGVGSHLQIVMKPVATDVGVFKEFVMVPDSSGALQPVGILVGSDLMVGGVQAKDMKFCNGLAMDSVRGRLAVGGPSLCVYSQ